MPEKKEVSPEQIEAAAKAILMYTCGVLVAAIAFVIVAFGIWIIGHA